MSAGKRFWWSLENFHLFPARGSSLRLFEAKSMRGDAEARREGDDMIP